MLLEDDLIPILPVANEPAAEEGVANLAALEGVEIVELIADFDAAGTSVDLGALFGGEATDVAPLEPVPFESGAEARTAESFAVSFSVGLPGPEEFSGDGGVV